RLAPGAEAVEERTADEGALRTKAERLEHVLAGANTAVDVDFDAVADRIDDLRQHRDRRRRAVELAAAMVGDDDRVGTGVGRHLRVLDVDDALDDQLAAPAFLDPCNVLPRQLRIELLGGPR